jgi:hypothetical protein
LRLNSFQTMLLCCRRHWVFLLGINVTPRFVLSLQNALFGCYVRMIVFSGLTLVWLPRKKHYLLLLQEFLVLRLFTYGRLVHSPAIIGTFIKP